MNICPHCGRAYSPRAIDPLIVRAAEVFDVSVDLLAGTSRSRRVSYARFAIAYILREYGMSLEEIGRTLGRDHTTIIYAVEQATQMMSQPLFARRVARLQAAIQRGEHHV